MGRSSGNANGDLTRVLQWGTGAGDGDARLLERFRAGRDESAFVALVSRHGPMVLGVCRRILRDEHDVEDAFQATFLVLVRSAGAIRRGERVGPWLHGVAHRIALRARAGAARRLVRERNGADVEALAVSADERSPDLAELRSILDAELARLPETFRSPLILCHLEGLTHEEAADRLGQPVGTIRSRLSRGRERLRARLARRGVSAGDAAWGSTALAEPVSTRLLEATVQAALDSTLPGHLATAAASASAASLVKGVLDAMLVSRLTLAGACALGLALTLGGVGGYAFQHGAGEEKKPRMEPSEPVAGTSLPKPTDDADQKLDRRLDQSISQLEQRMKELQDEKRGIEEDLQIVVEQLNVTRKKREDLRARPIEALAKQRVQPPDETARETAVLPVPSEPDGRLDPDHPRPLMYSQAGKMVIVASPDGRVVTGYNSETGQARTIRLAAADEPELEIVPMLNNVVGALLIRGLAVHRIAVFNSMNGRWHEQELASPATKAVPIIGGTGLACYTIGNRVYAFSGLAARWDVLELPEGEEPKPSLGTETITCRIGDRLHVFGVKTGKWTALDTSKAASDHAAVEHAPQPRPAPDRTAEAAGRAEYLDSSRPIVVPSPDGRVVTVFGVPKPTPGMQMMMGGPAPAVGGMETMMGGAPKPFSDPSPVRLAEQGDPQLEVTPFFNQGSISLDLRGEKIQRLAIFNMYSNRWDVQELREPVKEASPASEGGMTTYALGRRLYTYSSPAGKWSVLELPEGAAPQGRAAGQGVTLRYGDQIHIYNVQSGEWTHFDLRVKGDQADEREHAKK